MVVQNAFLTELRQSSMDIISKAEPGKSFEHKEWEFTTKKGRVAVNVLRGSLFEKVCVSEIAATVTIPGRDYESSIQWVGIQTFPKNPLVPMLMGVFENVREKGLEHCPCYFDVYPAVPFDEDKLYLDTAMSAVCKKYGRHFPNLPKGYLDMFQVKDAGIGVGYASGMALDPEEDNAALFNDAARTVLSSYFTLVDKRKDAAYADRHADEMFRFRAAWVQFIFRENRFFQGGVSLGAPIESFMLHMLPPTVKF